MALLNGLRLLVLALGLERAATSRQSRDLVIYSIGVQLRGAVKGVSVHVEKLQLFLLNTGPREP